MSARPKKILLLLLAALLLGAASQVQVGLNADRERLGLTRVEPLENAPPVLAFTTVALGGFRGLISNALWIHAMELQDQDKYFEMSQLADWITKLEPNFVQVWLVEAWNLAYNISIKFKDPPDRWRWVRRGLELLRDDGLRWNPNETLIYRELAWFFLHKMGANLDDANMYYKQQWANEMAKVFDKKTPNLDELIHPQTESQTNRARLLRETYKMDPEFMKEVDQRYGPLEWRLPESHAIYWACAGLKKAAQHPDKIKPEDLITLHRIVYHSMMVSFQRGRLIENVFTREFEFGPNLDIIPKVSDAYEEAAREDVKNHDHILSAHRNFLRDAVYFLFAHNRIPEAAHWFEYLCRQYPDKPLLNNVTNSLPGSLTLSEYAVSQVQSDVTDSSATDRLKISIMGLLRTAYVSLVLGQNDEAAGSERLAELVHTAYVSKTGDMNTNRIPMPPMNDLKFAVRNELLDPKQGLPPEVRAALRSKLGLEPEPPSVPPATNAIPGGVPQK
jgi:hypothetical protein